MKKLLINLFFIIIGLPVNSFAQNYILNGMVIDRTSNVHLPFVRVEVNNNKLFTNTDINGLFSIRSSEPIKRLYITYRGYQPLLIDVSDKSSPLVIKLTSGPILPDSLSSGRSEIYHYIDSVMHIDQYAQIKRQQDALLSGQIELGWFSLDMSRVKRFNQFEGLYLGLGGHTNEHLMRSVSLGGFAGYGFKDKKTKYGFDVSVWPSKDHIFVVNAGYSYDTRESGGTKFFDENFGTIEPSSFRFFYIDKMDYERKLSFSLSLKKDFADVYFAVQSSVIDRGYDISNGVKVMLPDQYNVSGVFVGIRLSTSEIASPVSNGQVSKPSLFPVLWLQVTRGVPGMFKGEYNFSRYEGKIQFGQDFRRLGRSYLQVVWNQLEGNAPYFEYFNGRGSFGNFGLYASGSFVTMHPSEFLNDRSIGLFFTHNFGKIFPHTEIFNPSPALVVNYGWGKLQKDPPFYYLSEMDMHKGFVEAGVQINNLLDLKVYGLGLGGYYRMGAYRNQSVKENLVFKIVISFPGKN